MIITKALTPRLELVLKGIKKQSVKYHFPHVRLLITLDIMQSICSVLGAAPEAHNNILMWAACCLAFFWFFKIHRIHCATAVRI